MIVYKITNILNDKAYVGQSQTSLERRWTLHKSDAKRNIDNSYFHKAIRKYGTECWKFDILEEIDDISNLNEAEMKWIERFDTFRNGYNLTSGGENGYIVSDETKEKISKVFLGKPKSEEHKEKLRQANLGKHLSEETKEKISKANLGKKQSEEHKEKLS